MKVKEEEEEEEDVAVGVSCLLPGKKELGEKEEREVFLPFEPCI